MKAREAMQALLDGKTLYTWERGYFDRTEFRLDEEGNLLTCIPNKEPVIIHLLLNDIIGEISECYPHTFNQAVELMLHGRVMECEGTRNIHNRFHDGRFERIITTEPESTWTVADAFPQIQQDGKWKVVGRTEGDMLNVTVDNRRKDE